MTCPKCGGATFVKDSRPDEDTIRRRRECAECKYRFSTVEIDIDYYEKCLKGTVRNETESCT